MDLKKVRKNQRINISENEVRTIYFPRQKVIFFEENNNIRDSLNLKIVFPDNQEVNYVVEVIKYWEFTDEDLSEKKMYPLIPLQLFSLRKELEKAQKKNDIDKINELSCIAKNLATKLSKEYAQLFENDEIFGEDFHKMLLAIQNLIEYLNRNYLNDDNIEKEVTTMTKTLYDPEVEKKGIEKGIEQAIGKMLIKGMDVETICSILDVKIDTVNKVKEVL